MPYSRGQLAQCDVILLKAHEAASDREQALRLVILSSVLGYYDYAVTVLRARADLRAFVEHEYGFDLEAQLGAWSASAGRHATKAAIKSNLRGLIPLFRSALGKLPYDKPRRPY
jgi:hypothetical protein